MSHILAMLAVSTVSALSTDSTVNPSGNGSEAQGMTTITTEPLPSPGTFNAWQFLAIAAGVNVPWSCEGQPARHSTPLKGASREGMIRAIAGYCGWNPAQDFGTQDLMARRKAQAEIAPAMGVIPMAPRPVFSATGFLAGMPDENAREVGNLQARIRLAKQAVAGFVGVKDLATFAKMCHEHIVDTDEAQRLIAAATAEGVANDAARIVREHESLLSKLHTELSAVFG